MGDGAVLESLYDEEEYYDNPTTLPSLLQAVCAGNARVVAHLLKNKAELEIDINEVDAEGRSCVILACAYGFPKIVSYLLQAGANPDLKDNEGYAAIHHCVLASGNKYVGVSRAASCVRALARFHSNIDRKTADGRSALHLAVQNSLTDITLALRDAGTNLDLFSTDGFNAIYYACQTATKEKTVASVINLIRLGANIDKQDKVTGRTALHIATEEGLPEIVRFLVLSKANVAAKDMKGATIFHILAQHGDMKCLDAIRIAIGGGEQVQADRKVDKQEKALMAVVSQADDLKMKRFFQMQDFGGNTPLHIACEYGYSDLVEYLLDHRADATIPNKASKAPYHLCCEVGHTKIFQMLIVRANADTSIAMSDGHTCLHFAAMNNDVDMAELQMDNAPNPNVQTRAGWTALHYAAAYDSLQVIVYLLDVGANVEIKNRQGQTPLQIAARSRTKKALLGQMRDQLEREAIEKAYRQKAMLEDRTKKLEEAKMKAIAKAKANKPLLTPRSQHHSDDEDDFDPLANKKVKAAPKEQATVNLPGSKPSSAKGGTGSHKASRLDRLSPRAASEAGSVVSAVSAFSVVSHAPGRERPVQRMVWQFKKKYGPVIQKHWKPVKDAIDPYWQHPAFVRQRKRIKYVFWRIRSNLVPVITGENVPSEAGSYHGTTGFTTAPNSARSQGTTQQRFGDGSATDRSSGSRAQTVSYADDPGGRRHSTSKRATGSNTNSDSKSVSDSVESRSEASERKAILKLPKVVKPH